MKRYRFRLEGVLKVRTTQEDLARAALAEANLGMARADEALSARHRRYSAMSGPTDAQPTEVFLGHRFLHELAAQSVRQAEHHRDDAHRLADTKRREWSAAAKEVSILERLDERRRAEHALESARQADVEADDIVVGRFGRMADEAARS